MQPRKPALRGEPLRPGSADYEVDGQTGDLAWSRTVDLALSHGLTSCDAAYLELALRLDLPLATLDKALAAAVLSAGGRLVPELAP